MGSEFENLPPVEKGKYQCQDSCGRAEPCEKDYTRTYTAVNLGKGKHDDISGDEYEGEGAGASYTEGGPAPPDETVTHQCIYSQTDNNHYQSFMELICEHEIVAQEVSCCVDEIPEIDHDHQRQARFKIRQKHVHGKEVEDDHQT